MKPPCIRCVSVEWNRRSLSILLDCTFFDKSLPEIHCIAISTYHFLSYFQLAGPIRAIILVTKHKVVCYEFLIRTVKYF